jgi:uncharacterized membrane protein YheB (UPF0754 family)
VLYNIEEKDADNYIRTVSLSRCEKSKVFHSGSDLLIAITKKEFTFIELTGGMFGFLIGIIQVLLLTSTGISTAKKIILAIQIFVMLLFIDLLSWKTWSIPIIGAFIGWITNWLAIKMLFHPRQPLKILFVTFHGIFPKNKPRIADKLGLIVQRDLINFTDIRERLQDEDALKNFKDEIAFRVENAIRDRIEKNAFLDAIVPDQLIQSVHKTIVDEIERNLPTVIGSSIDKIEQKLDIHELVRKKVAQFSDEKLEKLLLDITSKEFTFIEIIGGVLGFIIGIIQLAISAF